MRTTLTGILASAALAIGATAAAAQDFPTRSITIVVPYSPGSTDTMARTLANEMSNELGQPVVVETRPGAGGTVGGASVASADPDGYTLLFAVSSVQTVAPHQRDLPYGFDDLAPVARVAVGPNMMAARTGAPFTTIEELVAYAKENPGDVSYGSAGTGGATHIAAEAFARAAGVELFHIPFNGVTPAVAATVAGEVDLVLGFASAILPQDEGGKLVALAQLSSERTEVAPDVPTLIESGVDLALPPNTGLWAPAGTPDDVIATLAAAVEKAAGSDTFQSFAKSGLTAVDYAGSEAFTEVLKTENAFFAELLPTLKME
ncbi:tripartite-type tricarboxylate transporter receptor subunit TctC [Roseovarius halotolerans]|uniref:Tripartite tricarboxylate transporter family receptor n=1 Tax=Roseovarius halotolerans TaxID=505353 RepID=A0A1X6YYL2_9RHOB|nr:tripartite tricarboxylate transporter substrate binding protein [Roseovarius halotolerans]RKT32564.1 tripartite-type tricarboxylate transporter receptor subunit TctC [Roseovarius halotolerans]SLN35576.1 Tripartite tricarboxylate transporter family receptor [Roseovarius halotolerans]